jgi:hypothetical protein
MVGDPIVSVPLDVGHVAAPSPQLGEALDNGPVMRLLELGTAQPQIE